MDLENMIPFSREVFLDQVGNYNALLWPLHIAALLLGAILVYLSIRPREGWQRLPALLIAAGWLGVGVGYYGLQFSTLNWAAWLSAALFVTQSGLLVWTGIIRNRLGLKFDGSISGWTGIVFLVTAIAVYPLLGLATGIGIAAMPVVGIDPGPTVLATWGFLLLVRSRVPLLLTVIPFIVACVGAIAGWLIELPADLVLPAAAAASLCLILARRRGDQRSGRRG
jgi:hypothetical protein